MPAISRYHWSHVNTIPSVTVPESKPSNAAAAPLLALRAELDGIDDALHDLLMRRAEIVANVARVGAKGAVPLRPGREAEIIRRLLRRHSGPLPRRAIVRIWRELLAATTGMQGPFTVTVCETDAGNGLVQLTREHFGALTPLRVHRSPAQAIAEISAGRAAVAVLPMPAEEEASSAAWWTALLHRDDPRIHVIARLPFWTARVEGAPQARAFVVAAIAPDASGNDRSLLGFELDGETSRARFVAAVTAAGFAHSQLLVRRDPGSPVAHVLMEVDGLIAESDSRLRALTGVTRPPVILGAYAVPIAGDGA